MDKTTLGLIAAMGALAASPALASTSADVTDQIMKPRSVAELLEPIANPIETLARLDAARQLEAVEVADAEIQVGPLGFGFGHHHHHHHYYRHHHHHHQHYIYHHHHHHHYYRHHHHHHYNNY
jgi:hypothetical protein